MVPKVLALRRDVKVNVVNELFSFRRGSVAPCCVDRTRNIRKQIYRRLPQISGKGLRMATAASNILVVEDDRETRALIAKYLRGNACN